MFIFKFIFIFLFVFMLMLMYMCMCMQVFYAIYCPLCTLKSYHIISYHIISYQGSGMEPEPLNQGSSLALALDEDANESGNVAPVWLRGGKTVESSKNTKANKDVRQGDIFTKEFLKKYLFYAKTYTPELTDIAMEVISSAYANMRSKQTQRNLPVTARSLETIIRLSTASAKARLSNYVEEQDADQALALINYVMFHEIGSSPNAEANMTSALVGKRPRDSDDTLDPSHSARDHGYSGDNNNNSNNSSNNNNNNNRENSNNSFDNDFVAVAPPKSSNKYIRVQEQIRKLFDSSKSDLLYINDVLGKLNNLAHLPTERYSIPELKAILDDLERDNKIMLDDDMIQNI